MNWTTPGILTSFAASWMTSWSTDAERPGLSSVAPFLSCPDDARPWPRRKKPVSVSERLRVRGGGSVDRTPGDVVRSSGRPGATATGRTSADAGGDVACDGIVGECPRLTDSGRDRIPAARGFASGSFGVVGSAGRTSTSSCVMTGVCSRGLSWGGSECVDVGVLGVFGATVASLLSVGSVAFAGAGFVGVVALSVKRVLNSTKSESK